MKSEKYKNFSLFILLIAFAVFIYVISVVIKKVNKTQTGTNSGTYTSYITTSKFIEDRALHITKNCKDRYCQVQMLLNFVTDIPYKTETFQRCKPLKTIKQNFGDCDDKSNLLISLLHALNIEAYFVLVPKHIFVIVNLDDRRLSNKKGIWLNGKKYFILESTAKGSTIGYPLHYRLNQIDTIIEPFSNQQINMKGLQYNR